MSRGLLLGVTAPWAFDLETGGRIRGRAAGGREGDRRFSEASCFGWSGILFSALDRREANREDG